MSRMLRASAIMAAGTMVSRVTGFVRTMVLAYAIGTAALGDAYNAAYAIPYSILDLLLLGVLSSVVVPMVVRAQQHDEDGGRAYEQRLLSLATVTLVVVAALSVLAAPLLIDLYTDWDAGSWKFEVAVMLARFILPQLAFFGVGAVAGAILNTRDRYGAPMWAPVLNNVVVICVFLLYAVVGSGSDLDRVTTFDLALLGVGTTAGIVAQAAVLIVALRRAGFSFVPRFDLRNARLGEMAKAGVWTIGYVVVTQLGFVLTTNLSSRAGDLVPGHGISPYTLAFQLFQLPYGVIGVSVITAMLPRMSRSVAEGRFDEVRAEFGSSVRLVCSLMVPVSLLLMVLGPAITVPIYGHGANSVADAVYIGNVLQVYGLALVPFAIFQLLLRVFYSFGDTRTPVFIGAGTTAVNAVFMVLLYLVLPPAYVVMGLALAYAIAYGLGAVLAWWLAGRRVGGLGGWAVGMSLTRMYLAALPTAVLALAAVWVVTGIFGGLGFLNSVIVLAIGGGLGMVLYLGVAHRMRIPEVNSIVGMVARRVGR
ncbi:Proposed peptidoglycan lipid II flippase MurJ [[Actinomadura] parvosata subsp. kistnae]|uniref:Probable lipid II flippase MurJ n=1 Tax=[Actinomadura] parvosata subsp. kistnae TaxID=1909395 RepID=A0A1V0ACB5_9ACTN|nr:murein biosynthesis integral membrane protein MurJ [Nonomuraea sp. ATCC 55076]AQZ67861.1 murein biosynthesis integral membrane protein MurJ [Nonomuraea sp. ATCC 55076]SPL93803.1 Proposed peptidoglycan lipid II flippase MurJ [Actinomadura parvosata subsp. kistnae]